jgi:hypothetical protein
MTQSSCASDAGVLDGVAFCALHCRHHPPEFPNLSESPAVRQPNNALPGSVADPASLQRAQRPSTE